MKRRDFLATMPAAASLPVLAATLPPPQEENATPLPLNLEECSLEAHVDVEYVELKHLGRPRMVMYPICTYITATKRERYPMPSFKTPYQVFESSCEWIGYNLGHPPEVVRGFRRPVADCYKVVERILEHKERMIKLLTSPQWQPIDSEDDVFVRYSIRPVHLPGRLLGMNRDPKVSLQSVTHDTYYLDKNGNRFDECK